MTTKGRSITKRPDQVEQKRSGSHNSLLASVTRKELDPPQAAPAAVLTQQKMKSLAEALNVGITRRDVLKASALAASAAALPGVALALGAGRKRGQKSGAQELRSFVFDLSCAIPTITTWCWCRSRITTNSRVPRPAS